MGRPLATRCCVAGCAATGTETRTVSDAPLDALRRLLTDDGYKLQEPASRSDRQDYMPPWRFCAAHHPRVVDEVGCLVCEIPDANSREIERTGIVTAVAVIPGLVGTPPATACAQPETFLAKYSPGRVLFAVQWWADPLCFSWLNRGARPPVGSESVHFSDGRLALHRAAHARRMTLVRAYSAATAERAREEALRAQLSARLAVQERAPLAPPAAPQLPPALPHAYWVTTVPAFPATVPTAIAPTAHHQVATTATQVGGGDPYCTIPITAMVLPTAVPLPPNAVISLLRLGGGAPACSCHAPTAASAVLPQSATQPSTVDQTGDAPAHVGDAPTAARAVLSQSAVQHSTADQAPACTRPHEHVAGKRARAAES
jgi:hypothetical protein